MGVGWNWPIISWPLWLKVPERVPKTPKFKLIDSPVMSSCVTTAAWLGVDGNQNADAIKRAITLPLIVLKGVIFISQSIPVVPGRTRPPGHHDCDAARNVTCGLLTGCMRTGFVQQRSTVLVLTDKHFFV